MEAYVVLKNDQCDYKDPGSLYIQWSLDGSFSFFKIDNCLMESDWVIFHKGLKWSTQNFGINRSSGRM